jgi:hypothetical protein
MAGVSEQREKYDTAMQLSHEAAAGLQPLHDDLAELSPTFDGIVYFAKDHWHKNNASAVATVQPRSTDAERFAFYKEKIAHRRVDLGATALGEGFALKSPQLLRSRMNPGHHTTWAHRAVIDGTIAGGIQAAFNTSYGTVPDSTKALEAVWEKHESTVLEVAAAFETFSNGIRSIGDVLELEAPATPNAYIVSWDLRGSSELAAKRYGALRNYLLDTKATFNTLVSPFDTYTHDTGDGQDIALWIPETSDTFDRANQASVRGFGKANVLPLIETLLEAHDRLVTQAYPDIKPDINIALGLGYIEHDAYDGRTSAEYWESTNILKAHPNKKVSYTKNAQETLFPEE